MIRLDRSVPFVREALEGSFEDAAAIFRNAELRHGLRWLAIPENRPEDNSAEWYREHQWPFLSETHMVLGASDLQASGCTLLDTTGVDHTPTFRHWGQIVADWANDHWMPRPIGLGRTRCSRETQRWHDLDFYDSIALQDFIEGYDDWRAAVWRVLWATGCGDMPDVPLVGPVREA